MKSLRLIISMLYQSIKASIGQFITKNSKNEEDYYLEIDDCIKTVFVKYKKKHKKLNSDEIISYLAEKYKGYEIVIC